MEQQTNEVPAPEVSEREKFLQHVLERINKEFRTESGLIDKPRAEFDPEVQALLEDGWAWSLIIDRANHLQKVKPVEPPKPQARTYPCRFCAEVCSSPQYLASHMRYSHPGQSSAKEPMSPEARERKNAYMKEWHARKAGRSHGKTEPRPKVSKTAFQATTPPEADPTPESKTPSGQTRWCHFCGTQYTLIKDNLPGSRMVGCPKCLGRVRIVYDPILKKSYE